MLFCPPSSPEVFCPRLFSKPASTFYLLSQIPSPTFISPLHCLWSSLVTHLTTRQVIWKVGRCLWPVDPEKHLRQVTEKSIYGKPELKLFLGISGASIASSLIVVYSSGSRTILIVPEKGLPGFLNCHLRFLTPNCYRSLMNTSFLT